MLRVADTQNGVQAVVLPHVLVQEECRCYRRRVCQACCLDEHAVQVATTSSDILEHLLHAVDEVAPQSATDAAIVHLHNGLCRPLGLLDQRRIDVHLAELVLNHRNPLPMLLTQDAVEEGRLAAPQEARDDGHRDLLLLLLLPALVVLFPALTVPLLSLLDALQHLRRPACAPLLEHFLGWVQLSQRPPRRVHAQQRFSPYQVAHGPLPRPNATPLARGMLNERAGAETPSFSVAVLQHQLLGRLEVGGELVPFDHDRWLDLAAQHLLLRCEPQVVTRLGVPRKS
mmetsp:Transcript_72522/g.168022  ORF Transcript_72522/g.168022 Transcript_72522/m.168022 type:complete len:285 (-) Transcript_72522:69-923(-)